MTEIDKIKTLAHQITTNEVNPIRFSVCTLVSKHWEYFEMIESFKKAGFEDTFTEFIFIDNATRNEFDAYNGLNQFLLQAKGEFIILCHQDILLEYDNIEKLEKCIADLDNLDENWGIMSNAGASGIKDIVYRLYEPNNVFKSRGNPVQKVTSVDENFILVKKSANLAFSSNLRGFHLYGTDLCIIANILGYNAYVVDFKLLHKSKGSLDSAFYQSKKDMQKKYTLILNGRYIQTTCTNFYLSGGKLKNDLLNSKIVLFFVRNYISITSKYRNHKHEIPKTEW